MFLVLRSSVLFGSFDFFCRSVTNPAEMHVIADWRMLTTVREMQSFLILVNVCDDYIVDATKLAAPLYVLTV